MRIRKRPTVLQPSPSSSSSSSSPDPSLQQPPREERTVHQLHPHGDLPDLMLQTLHPLPNTTCHVVLKEEKVQVMDPQLTSDHNSLWCNEEGAITVPTRKRRGNRVDDSISSASANRTSRLATREGSGKGKKRASSRVLMEGARCSRMNGRGWRCSQQTLVGYSLCEHHLGKGRLRTMDNVCRSKLKNEKRRNMGTMKARSMSSLLDEADNAAAAILSSLSVPVLDIDKGSLV